jgi:hypothetical protein
MSSSSATPAGPTLPPVDANIVTPETRYEMFDGVLVHVPPAKEPHGTRHSKAAALVEAHAAPDFDVACDMLTRTSHATEFAPDVSVFPRARNPVTGGRQLEHLAFEIVSTESLGHASERAAALCKRGVRRVFAIDIVRVRALEWSSSLGTWSLLDRNSHIADAALAAPLPISALLSAATVDDAVARALIIKRNAVIEADRADSNARSLAEGLARGRIEGLIQHRAEVLFAVLAARGVSLDRLDRERIAAERDPEQLLDWLTRAATCTSAAEVFDNAAR